MKRGVKVSVVIFLTYIIFKSWFIFDTDYKTKTGLTAVPLLEQPVNKHFNRENVWISMSFCYAAAWPSDINRDAVIKAVLATRLWRDVSDANVVLQVYNDTEILENDIERLNMVTKRGTRLIWADRSDAALCDCSLDSSVGRLLLHTIPEINEYLQQDSIVVLTNIGSFLSKGEILNVLQSGHKTWMYNAEAVFYGGQPFPTSFIAMTVENWKTTTYNSNSCSELLDKDSHISDDYKPPWVVKMEESKEFKLTDIDVAMGFITMEKFILRRALLLKHCTVPGWNAVWGNLEAEEGYDPNFFDLDTCWKGMGMASCSNTLGYWHYPGMPGCSWWTEQFPQEVFEELIKPGDPLIEMAKETSILFSSI